ncbi:MAG: uroporphyrinogen decarboxylase [Puniceicoccales bacterium]
MINSRTRFLDALACRNSDRPPVWLMRQAGRYLPEYRALKQKTDFRTMVRTPDLATEVTLQPLQRFPQLDAAILFSDILVIPEALGVDYRFRDEGGIELERTVRNQSEVDSLTPEGTAERLSYVGEALQMLRKELGEQKTLLGFCGAPWTLALYLVEGGSPGEGRNLRELLYRDPTAARKLLHSVTQACAEYVRLQCQSGADAIQLFDSWAALCPTDFYEEWCLDPIRKIREACDKPMILFSRGAAMRLADQISVGTEAIAIDWSTPLLQARATLGPKIALQGNLDPLLLETDPETVRSAATRILKDRKTDPGFIFNCGHGLSPKAKIACVEALLDTICQ